MADRIDRVVSHVDAVDENPRSSSSSALPLGLSAAALATTAAAAALGASAAAVVGLRAARRSHGHAAAWLNVAELLPSPVKSEEDARSYRALRLANGLRVVLISDMASTRAAAAMSVAVGHFSDPPELCGLAHFLEHMLFLGTERYPDEAEYKRYLSKHGGRSNASTNTERTLYHFEIDGRELGVIEGALDRFSQFYVAPLMSASCVARELGAIDNEFQLKYESDSRRFYQTLKSSADVDLLLAAAAAPPSPRASKIVEDADVPQQRPALGLSHVPWSRDGRLRHPMYKMSCGNVHTLRDLPAQATPPIDVQAKLREFWRTNYTAEAMVLVVTAPHSLDALQAMVASPARFAGIPAHRGGADAPFTPPIARYAARPHPYDYRALRARTLEAAGCTSTEAQLQVPRCGVLLELCPVKSTRSLKLLWATPELRTVSAARPWSRIFTHLLGHEGEGSLFAVLKKKSLATSLSAGYRTEQSCFSVLQISITLTDAADGERLPGSSSEAADGLEDSAEATEVRRTAQRLEIVRLVFAYLAALREASAASLARVATEVALNRSRSFRFRKKSGASATVRSLAAQLTYFDYPHATRDVLSRGHHGEGAVEAVETKGGETTRRAAQTQVEAPTQQRFRRVSALGAWDDSDDTEFRSALALMTPLRLTLHHVSPHFGSPLAALCAEGDHAIWHEEHWYKTRHRVRFIPSTHIDVWDAALQSGDVTERMHLPASNELIPTNFTVIGAAAKLGGGSRGSSSSSSKRKGGARRAAAGALIDVSELPCSFRPSAPTAGSATAPTVLIDSDLAWCGGEDAPSCGGDDLEQSETSMLALYRTYDASGTEVAEMEEVRAFADEMRESSSRLWYKLDRTFLRPTALIRIYVIAPIEWRTSVQIIAKSCGGAAGVAAPSAAVLAAVHDICSAAAVGGGQTPAPSTIDVGAAVWRVAASLHRRLVKDAMTEFSYDAALAGMRWGVGINGISVSGFNDKLLVLLARVLKDCAPAAIAARLWAAERAVRSDGGECTVSDDDQRELDRFRRVHENMLRGLQDWCKKRPLDHANEFANLVLRSSAHLTSNAALIDVAQRFAERPGAAALLIDAMYRRHNSSAAYESRYGALIETVVGGNISAQDARRAQQMTTDALQPLPLLPALRLERRSSGCFDEVGLPEDDPGKAASDAGPLPPPQPQWEGSGILWLDRPQQSHGEANARALEEAFQMADVMGGDGMVDADASESGGESGGGDGLAGLGHPAKSTSSRSRHGSRAGSRISRMTELSVATVESSSQGSTTTTVTNTPAPGGGGGAAFVIAGGGGGGGGGLIRVTDLEDDEDDVGSFYTAESGPTRNGSLSSIDLGVTIDDSRSRGREDAAASAAERCAVDETVVFSNAPNVKDMNSAIVNVYQLPRAQKKYTDREAALLSLLCHVMRQPAFSTLRTERQLGYIVRTSYRAMSRIHLAVEQLDASHLASSGGARGEAKAAARAPLPGVGVLALQLSIQSKTHSPPELNREIESFLESFGVTMRSQLEAIQGGDAEAATSFATQRESLAQLLVKPPDSFESEFNSACHEISQQTRCFARAAQKAGVVRNLTLSELVVFYERCVYNPGSTTEKSSGSEAPALGSTPGSGSSLNPSTDQSAPQLQLRRTSAKLSVQVFGAKHEIPPHFMEPGGMQTVLREDGPARVRYVSLADVVAFKEARPEWPQRPNNH